MPVLISRKRTGFTLLELVVVLLIVATLAGLAIPVVSMLGRSSDMAASASSQRELASNIQLYFVLQKRFPQGFDSLIVDGGGAIYTPIIDGTTGQQTGGLPDSGPHLDEDLTVSTLTDGQRRSFTRSGFDWVYDHDTSVINSNNTGVVKRFLDRSDAGMKVAAVIPGSDIALKLLPQGVGANGTPGTPAPGSIIVALGIGPNNSAIGKTINSAPIYPGNDGTYYGRYVAFFEVFESGERAVLIGVSDSYGRAMDYTIQQFNESLPNGARRG